MSIAVSRSARKAQPHHVPPPDSGAHFVTFSDKPSGLSCDECGASVALREAAARPISARRWADAQGERYAASACFSALQHSRVTHHSDYLTVVIELMPNKAITVEMIP